MANKKLIEVALPLEKINAESAREKSIRHGHPSTLHLWWARRPLAAARAVIWSSLVDDPSSHPEQFPTEEEQTAERQRLFKILEDLVVWENSNNEEVLTAAKAEIMKSTGGNPPALLDPFAGGGAIPLEAQRLGLEAHASDLNPVAVMINKAMIEIPPRFAGQAPVNPEARAKTDYSADWKGAQGLAEDVRYYGEWMKQEAFKRIGHLYPKVKVPKEQGGGEATVIAWIWARTVKCPNPACGCEMPLASKFVLSRKKGKEAWIEPILHGNVFDFAIHKGKCPADKETLKLSRGAIFKCPKCGESTLDSYVKAEGKKGNFGHQLMAIVAEGPHGRIYIAPTDEQEDTADVSCPDNVPEGAMPNNPRWFSPPAFGMNNFSDVFTNRQLISLCLFCDLLPEIQNKVCFEIEKHLQKKTDERDLADGGIGARAYSQAVAVYLAFIIDQMTNHNSSLCGWHANNEQLMNTFGRQALPMVWDYAEVNPFSNSTGSFNNLISRMIEGLQNIGFSNAGFVKQFDAQSDSGFRNIMVSTDPPYYDNIGYADLSDYFYIWLRRSLKHIYPKLFRTLLVPKAEELVATPYRFHGSTNEARKFFEDGMAKTCAQIYRYASDDIPVTIYYAYKQSETDASEDSSQTASSGWETMLSAIVQAGFAITGTWPVRTEQTAALKTTINALASSIVLVCRKRLENAPTATRRNFINELKRELKPALQKLQRSNIAPVDLAQSAIGPGMGVYSRYSKVLEADGSAMTVRSALQIINQELDVYFNEQDGELDRDSRFCVDLYTQNAFNDMKFGDADTLARAKNTSVAALASRGVLYAQKGVVHLHGRDEIYLTNKPFFAELACVSVDDFQKALKETDKLISAVLNHIASRLGLDHDRVLGSRYSIPLMVGLLHQQGGKLKDNAEWDKLLYWYIHTFLWGRYSGSTESVLAQDLNVLTAGEGIDGLIRLLRQSRGDLSLRGDDFWGWSSGARFYPLLYMLTRVYSARDWGSGVELKGSLLGKLSTLDVHHIFPKKILYDAGYNRTEVNALANYTFLTKETNIAISDKPPKEYFPIFLAKTPGALESHWIPLDEELRSGERYPEFLACRREMLAKAANGFLSSLLNGQVKTQPIQDYAGRTHTSEPESAEEETILSVAIWMEERGLSGGEMYYNLVNEDAKELAIIDLAWPNGILSGLTEPVALLLGETPETQQIVNAAGYRFFTSVSDFTKYVEQIVPD